MHSFLRSLFIVALGLTLVRGAPTVTIPAGTLHGTTCPNGASAFLSIPFAIPPIGSLRWTSPQAYNETFPVSGHNATTQGAECIQFGTEFLQPGNASEDWYFIVLPHLLRTKLMRILSLYLNVWVAPNATSTSNLPVKVWIHGGGDQGGAIQDPLFDGCNLAGHGTILVSISYRLGPLGFLTLATAGIAGNFGVQDIILGLEWVQSHIAAFGGNPVS
jgi:carboxylesterase type B